MRIKNWHQFQHFKDRRPPWIKLYRDLLDDLEWHNLDPKASKTLVMLWLIASEDDGKLPSLPQLAFRLRLPEQDVKAHIIKLSHWLEQDDINVISDRYQHDAPETETETEKRQRQKATDVAAPEGVSQEVWTSFLKQRKTVRAVVTPTVINTITAEAKKAGWTLERALSEVVARGWRGFKADWVKAEPVVHDGPDPGLQKIKQDLALAAPMPSHIRETLAKLKGRP